MKKKQTQSRKPIRLAAVHAYQTSDKEGGFYSQGWFGPLVPKADFRKAMRAAGFIRQTCHCGSPDCMGWWIDKESPWWMNYFARAIRSTQKKTTRGKHAHKRVARPEVS